MPKKNKVPRLLYQKKSTKSVQIGLDDQVLSYLFKRDMNKSTGETFLEKKNKQLRYSVDFKVSKIKEEYDLFIHKELVSMKKKVQARKDWKIFLTSEDKIGFDMGAEYLVKVLVKVTLSKAIYDKIQQNHIGS